MSSKKKQEVKKLVSAKPTRDRISEQTLNRIFVFVLFVLPFILYRDFLSGSKMLFGSDFIYSGGYAARQFLASYIQKHSKIPLWLPHIYCGIPTVGAFLGDIFYPLSLVLRLFIPVHLAWTYTFIFQIFLAGLGTYLFLKELKVSPIAAFVLALAYMFSGSVISNTHEGHDGRLICTTMLPLVLFFLERAMNSKRFYNFLLSGTMLGLQFLSGHIQQAYYTGLIVIIYFLFRLISDYRNNKDARRFAYFGKLIGFFILTAIFTGCLVAIQYLPVYDNLPNGVRGAARSYEFATSWAMGPEETFDLITPRFSGGLDHYWGRNPFKHHTEYLGILPLILALIGIIFCWRERITKFFFGLLLFTLLMAWGGHTPFYYLPYYLLPGVSKFRAPALIFFTSAFSIITLAGIGLKFLIGELKETKSVIRFLLWVCGVGIGLLIITLIGQSGIVSFLSGIAHSDPNRISDNYSNFQMGMIIAVLLIIINSGLLYALVKRKLKSLTFATVAGLVLLIDSWLVGTKYIKPYPAPNESFAQDEVVDFLKKDTGYFRVFPLYYIDLATGVNKSDLGLLWLNNIHSVGGQHPNPLQNYMDFVGIKNSVMFQFPPNLLNRKFIDLLNVKYIVSVPLPEDISKFPPQSQQMIQLLKQYVSCPGVSLVYLTQKTAIYRNDSLLPRAFLVPKFEVIVDKDAALNRLQDNAFDPRRIVILNEAPEGISTLTDTIIGNVQITDYDPNRITLEVDLRNSGFLVLSENYHPDWKALVDGEKTKVYRAFHTLRAVYLEPGKHTVAFICDSKSYRLGRLLTFIAVLFLILVITVTAFRQRQSPAPIVRHLS
uniref:YfhO family protein n=1 Tax=candidate division WOR-3 bacterium TaxID=2052148 RepID=A0A7C6AAF2_UNCW3